MKTVDECHIFQKQNLNMLHAWSNDWVQLHEISGKFSDHDDILKKNCLSGALNFSVHDLNELMTLMPC